MRKILKRVTVTGADDSVRASQLWTVAKKYPFVEFGILLSAKVSMGAGASRFPSWRWLTDLTRIAGGFGKGQKPKLSGHVCGRWVGGFLTGHFFDWDRIAGGFGDLFERFQINTHAQPYETSGEMYDLLDVLDRQEQEVIFQLDGALGQRTAEMVVLNGWKKVSGLFDLSHGAGVLPLEWPKPLAGLRCGYAGGLSPENVAGQLEKIEQVCGDEPTWIDAETNLYTGGTFDLEKVEAFLEAASPWVID